MRRILFSQLANNISQKLFSQRYSQVVKMRLEKDVLKKFQIPGLHQLKSVFAKNGYEIRMVGGSVRDVLCGVAPNDFDFATTAKVDDMECMFKKAKIRIVCVTGVKRHGTVKAEIAGTYFECTPLQTNNLHNPDVTELTRNWEYDARNRDLTINALYLGFDGTLYDYCNGLSHLKNKHVLFVGNASNTIKADYLRILRYFRFFGRLNESGIHDKDAINAIIENANGLLNINSGRIYSELKKILADKQGYQMMEKMKECGIFPYIGLSETFDLENFHKIYNRSITSPLREMVVLTAGFKSSSDADTFINRITDCSQLEKNIIDFIIQFRNRDFSSNEIISMLMDFKFKKNMSKLQVYIFIDILGSYNGLEDEYIKILKLPCFPVNEDQLNEISNSSRKEVLKKLKKLWKNSNYTMTKQQLLTSVCVN